MATGRCDRLQSVRYIDAFPVSSVPKLEDLPKMDADPELRPLPEPLPQKSKGKSYRGCRAVEGRKRAIAREGVETPPKSFTKDEKLSTASSIAAIVTSSSRPSEGVKSTASAKTTALSRDGALGGGCPAHTGRYRSVW